MLQEISHLNIKSYELKTRSNNVTSYMPKYVAIKEYITENIKSKKLKPGDQILSEHELALLFNVSRVTANTAIRELATQGVVERKRGKGTFVREQEYSEIEMYHDISKYRKISSEFTESKKHIIEDISVIDPDEKTRKRFGLEISEKVYRITRLMITDQDEDIPVAIDYSYIPVKHILDNEGIDFKPLSSTYLHEFLSRETDIDLKFVHIHVDAKLADKHEAGILNVAVNYPLIIWDTILLDNNNSVVAFTTTTANPKKYRAFINFEIKSAGMKK